MPPADVQDVALVLSGGVGLGAYQAGVYSALRKHRRLEVVWAAGSSIGAVNAALVAGNKPEDSVAQLHRFWIDAALHSPFASHAGPVRHAQNWMSAVQARLFGVPGHFEPRWEFPQRDFASFYSLQPIRARIQRLVDFKRLNEGDVRVSIATTDIESGELVIFDNRLGTRIEVDHLLASCGYLPEFAPIEIGGRLVGDGGLSANAPIEAILGAGDAAPSLIFVVDLFARDGSRPRDLETALARKNDLMFANQTYQRLEAFRREAALARGRSRDRDARRRIVHLSYRPAPDEAGPEKAFDYSRPTLDDRWRAGELDYEEAARLLKSEVPDLVISVRRQ